MEKQILYDTLVRYILENQDKFYRLAYSYTRQKEDALDAVQNTVCKALESYESIQNESAIKTWFYRVLTNECLLLLKKSKKVILCTDELGQEQIYYESGYEKQDDLEDEVHKLDLETQGIIKLRFFEEMSLKEIAAITRLKENTVKTKLYRGLKALKENMEEVNL